MQTQLTLLGTSAVFHHGPPEETGKITGTPEKIKVLPADQEYLAQLLSKASSVTLDDFRLEHENGEVYWVSGFFDKHAAPALTLFDITRRKLKEIKQEETKERLALVLEGTRLGMWDWNPQTNDVVFDRRWAEMLGLDFSEIEHNLETWSTRTHPEDIEGAFKDIQAHMDGKTKFYENVHRMRHRDGHWVYILDRGKVAKRDEEGNAIRFTGTHTDITREKTAELRALEASKSKSYFLAQMSHEIRTPLHGILGFVDLLRRSNLNDEQKNYLNIVDRSSNTLLKILNDILDISRAEAGQFVISPTTVDFHQTLKDTFLLFQEAAIRKKIHYSLEIDEEVNQYIVADENRLRQVLSNLLNNALKFTESGSVVCQVRQVFQEGKNIRLQIKIVDTGPGIPADKIHSVFDKFAQLENSTSRTHTGTGLGLAICKHMVELMGGEISLESTEGVGATFIIEVPAKIGIARRELPADKNSQSFPGLRILIAEDNEINQFLLSKFLEDMDVTPSFVDNGKAALSSLQSSEFDLVFMDLHMPELDGFETMAALKDSKRTDLPPVVALTADAYQETKQACLNAGMRDFLSKPFNHDQLQTMIARYAT